LLTKAERYGYALERNSYLHGMFDEQFILESLESSDPNIAFLNNQLQQANAMFFERIVEKQLGLPTPAIDISPVEVVEAVDAVASSTTQTVETSMKEGVQSIQGFGNWMLKSTEALQKTGGEALEKHAITSRWVAGGVAAVTLLVGSCVAYTISKFKPEKSVTSNTR
jgi:ABC-type glycerol-3-phosphate transport system permease component